MENRVEIQKIYTKNNYKATRPIWDRKAPPQAIDLEEAILGAYARKIALNDVIDIIHQPEIFYKEAHQKFIRLYKIYFLLQSIDILTVTQELNLMET